MGYTKMSWLSFGVVHFTDQVCLPKMHSKSPLGRIIRRYLRPTSPGGGNPTLRVDWPGHRKYILRPDKVHRAEIHRVAIFDGEGIDLDTGQARLNHYRGFPKKKDFCLSGH